MRPSNYEQLCKQMIQSVMQYINTTGIKCYNIDHKNITNNYGPIYKSAVASKSPISLIYTPPGTGKISLVKDRITGLEKSGIPSEKILLLNMNIAKARQMQREFPGIISKTFSEFMHDIIAANVPSLETADLRSITSLLKIHTSDALSQQFINVLSINEPQERNCAMALFINKNAAHVLNILKIINLSDYSIDSMLCHNMMYNFTKTPYDVDTIIINGVQNMPVSALCSVLEYSNKYKSNLFITGNPGEAIYEFSMAYSHAMDLISSYNQWNIDVIHLNNIIEMDKNIKDSIEMTPNTKIDGNIVSMAEMRVNYEIPIDTIMDKALKPVSGKIEKMLSNSKQTIFLAKSRYDIRGLKSAIIRCYGQSYPDLKLADLTEIQFKISSYGTVAADHYKELSTKYTNGISTNQLLQEIKTIMNHESKYNQSPMLRAKYKYDLDELPEFIKENQIKLGDLNQIYPLAQLLSNLIYLEASLGQEHEKIVQSMSMDNLDQADIILSTIHSSIDIQTENAVIFLKNNSDIYDNNMTRVAMSRATEMEHIVFVNYGTFELPHQKYLKTHIHT